MTDATQHPRSPLVHIVQTLNARPSEWSAWDTDGNWYYLRYRFGRGTVEVCNGGPAPGSEHLEFVDALSDATLIAEFRHGGELDGEIGLDEFLELAGLDYPAADIASDLPDLADTPLADVAKTLGADDAAETVRRVVSRRQRAARGGQLQLGDLMLRRLR